jgi:hypothetical protein
LKYEYIKRRERQKIEQIERERIEIEFREDRERIERG